MTSPTILIVDDSTINRKVLAKILALGDYRLIQAVNGQEALDLMQDTSRKIDLVLLDIVMPVLNGHQVLQAMNDNGLIKQIPVIVMTGDTIEETELQCLREGASDFVRKPYNVQLVLHRVSSILRLWNNARLVNTLENDRLTGIYNKDSFLHYGEEAVSLRRKEDLWVLYMTIEDFSLLVTKQGNRAGDMLLQYMGKAFKQAMHRDDPLEVTGRVGQKSFAAVVRAQKLLDQEEAGRLNARLTDGAPIKGVKLKSGLYRVTDLTVPFADMVGMAKLAAEAIKHRYGVYYGIYDEAMRREALRDHQLTNYMEEALEKNQFVVYLQPKHSTLTKDVAGAEALIRWIHPELGFISPGEFIPLFEKNGFISKVDYFVWQKVCCTLRQWLDKGIEPVPISVNASRADFLDPDLPEKIANLVEKYDIPQRLLHVEVTESAYTDNPQQIIEAVSVLRDMGFKIEMDDFGSGYSSLNMLSELPIDILKLDMRFMQTGTNRLKGNKRNILSFIVSLSKWLQLPTVAEGVETKAEFELLKSMGCNLIQGYFFSKPMPIEEFAAYMAKHRSAAVAVSATPKIATPEKAADENSPLVLIVEDIESNRRVMEALLKSTYRVVSVENGKLAYDYIKEHYREISCITLDLLMPVMDGFQLLELLYKHSEYSRIPVIITTETGSNSELRALNLGANSFVAKPYNPDVLRHHVRKAIEELHLRETEARYNALLKSLGTKPEDKA